MKASRDSVVRRSITIAAAVTLTAGLAACGDSGGDDSAFPDGDINFIVQAAAGGGSDMSSRALAAEMEEILGVSIIVENRPGASGSTAMQYVADQDPDGYTIGFVPVEIAMLAHQGFDVEPDNHDFLGQIMLGPGVIAVPADSEAETLDDLIAMGSERALTFANSGAGSIWEAGAVAFGEQTGAQVQPVPFDGGAPAVAAAMGGQVDAVVAGAGETAAAHDDGTLRVLALLHDEEHPLLDGVPTAPSLGYDELQFGGWGGVYAPADLPDEVRDVLADAVEQAAKSDGFADAITPSGSLTVYKSPEEFTEFVNSEYERFASLLG